MHKKSGNIKKKISELSAGEKREALISLVYAFLVKSQDREKNVIIAIDEPENSLHTSICYEQFEKLKKVYDKNQITTHWYGFLPIIMEGTVHFLKTNGERIEFLPEIDLSDIEYKTKNNPQDFTLKSTNDLVQSIFYSLKAQKPYNWLICEGKSDKIYLDYFLKDQIQSKNLRIIAVGGVDLVKNFYKYLKLPIKNEKENLKGKIFCLIDTDQDEHKKHISDKYENVKIRRLSNRNTNSKTELLCLNNPDNSVCDIEQSLNPTIFQKTIDELNIEEKYKIISIEKDDGNSHFIKNFNNTKIENFFKENNGENKTLFAKKYVEMVEVERNKLENKKFYEKI